MPKYHVSEDGHARPCGATVEPCPLGGDHYSSADEARSAFEASMKDQTLQVNSKKTTGLSMEKIGELARNWQETEGAEWDGRYADPDEANGLCTDVSEDFSSWVASQGADAEVLDFTSEMGPHSVSVIGGNTVVDFTFRQFQPWTEVPVIAPLDEYRASYSMDDTDGWEISDRYRP